MESMGIFFEVSASYLFIFHTSDIDETVVHEKEEKSGACEDMQGLFTTAVDYSQSVDNCI